jgi:hypothetical protein
LIETIWIVISFMSSFIFFSIEFELIILLENFLFYFIFPDRIDIFWKINIHLKEKI